MYLLLGVMVFSSPAESDVLDPNVEVKLFGAVMNCQGIYYTEESVAWLIYDRDRDQLKTVNRQMTDYLHRKYSEKDFEKIKENSWITMFYRAKVMKEELKGKYGNKGEEYDAAYRKLLLKEIDTCRQMPDLYKGLDKL